MYRNCTDPLEGGLESLGFDLGINITPNGFSYSLDRSGLVSGYELKPKTKKPKGSTAFYASDLPRALKERVHEYRPAR